MVIWPEHLGSKAFLEGVDQAQLAADFQEITGRALPVRRHAARARAPDTSARPGVPAETLLGELAAYVRSVAASAEKDITELLAFLASHGL